MSNDEKESAYADIGPQFMGSYAERHFYYDVDANLAKRYNENYKKMQRFAMRALIIALITGVLSIWLYSLGGIWFILLGAITTLISIATIVLAILVFKRLGSPTALLKRGVLNAGIISQIDSDGIGILVLAETTRAEEVHWGLCSIKIKELPSVHEKKIGEKVPVTCVFSSDSGFNYNNAVTPSLIAWGTSSRDVIQKAIDQIDKVEWEALSQSIDRYDFKPEYSEPEQLKQLTLKEIVELKLYNA
ncbi:DUF3239 domain-containing protein [Dysgonomonas sp. HDW5A]|uniref:DUF3239 domain-containing protein n=1 Tax=Dysgonomonas sp. HDW5A TaxID=2714926 RepID=UPI00140DA111|nr:DUF3239 domain-containing protein [Dysgonomonas sp. HDW5A]QIK60019.1 DUF3239 domain-containing protein [Dysgonomonas sp. HDW5A]